MIKISSFICALVWGAQVFALSPLIFGGDEVSSSHPIAKSTVLLKGQIYRSSFTCTATIVADDLLMTAAHCLGGNGWADLTAYFETRADGNGTSIEIIDRRKPATALPTNQELDWDDIALLKLKSKIPNGYIPVTFLKESAQLSDGATVILAGYGRATEREPLSGDGGVGVLRAVKQNILQAKLGQTEILINIKGKGSCKGDSGGPAYIDDGKNLFYFGLASRLTEKDLVSAPSARNKLYECIDDMIYTNVLSHKSWLEKSAAEMGSQLEF